ncbi:MAG: hypothetical protein ABW134_11670 [Candidatus Thiodiazotropha endolucinida]
MRHEIILNTQGLTRLMTWVNQAPKDRTWKVTLEEYSKTRSNEQNRLQRLWLKEAEKQGDMTAEEYRGYCKLHFGVPIMRRDSEEFQEVYDRLIRPRPYVEKLELMMIPMDMPVTRIMTVKQKTEYLSSMCKHFVIECGFKLTDPGEYL